MDGKSAHLPPGDPQLITNIVNHLKSQGIFDQFRRDLLADADTKPSYQNLRQRVEGYASKFLAQQTWQPDLNKNQLRDTLRRQINESGMLASGVDHVLEQLLSPKIFHVFLPQVENLVKEYLGLKKPPTPDPSQNSDKVVSDLKTDASQQKTEEVATAANNSNVTLKRPLEQSTLEPADTKPPRQDAKVTTVPACPENTDDEMADDSLVISESGAEQSDSSMLDYTGPMGKTPPPPGVSDDELLENWKKVSDLESTEKEESQGESLEKEQIGTEVTEQELNETETTKWEKSNVEPMDQENSGTETNLLDAESSSQDSDNKDAHVKHVPEEEKTLQQQDVGLPEKKPESVKVISEKEKKSEKPKTLPAGSHEKPKSAERDRSKSVDPAKSSKVRSDNSQPTKMHEGKPKKGDGPSSKSKQSFSSGGQKKQESGHSKTSRDPTKPLEQKTAKSSLESPAKLDKHRSSSAGHSSKSAAASSSSSRSSKSKTSSSFKSEGKTTSTKSDSSKTTSKHGTLESKSKHSVKHAQKHRSSEDSIEEKTKQSSVSQTKSQPSEEKHEKSRLHGSKSQGAIKTSSTQKTKLADDRKGDQKRLSKEGKHSKMLEKVEFKDSESKLCKDGHGCAGKISEKQLRPILDSSSNEESISSPQTCGTSTGCDSETNTGSIPGEKCKPAGSDVDTNVDDTVEAVPTEADSEENSTSCEDRPDDFLRELLMEKETNPADQTKSDITVSSVHTSDLSSYDDGISLSSADEIPEVEQKKKIPLKEVKVIAAVLKEKSNSSGRSTPVMSSVEPEANKQEPFFQSKEIQQDDAKLDEFHAEEDHDGSKMWLRRQRKVNPKYTSEEYMYSSIFNEGTNTWDSDSIEDVPSKRITRSSQDTKLVAAGSSRDGTSAEKQEAQKRRFSKVDEPEAKPKPAKIAKKTQPVENTLEMSSKKEGPHKQRRMTTRSDSESQEVPEQQAPTETSRRKRQSTSSTTVSPDAPKHESQTRALISSQRYDSSDLYKPRPVITSRRNRSTQEIPNTQDTSTKGRTTRQSSPAPKRK